jgi:shikimate kinase
VAELTGRLDQAVVAAGGGAFVEAPTRRALQAGALTVWLSCRWEIVSARLAGDGIRPKATDRARMRELFVERLASYRQADVVVDVTELSIAEAARKIEEETFSARGRGAAAGE